MIYGIYKESHIIHANHLRVLQKEGRSVVAKMQIVMKTSETTASFSQATIAAICGSQNRACSETDVQTAQ